MGLEAVRGRGRPRGEHFGEDKPDDGKKAVSFRCSAKLHGRLKMIAFMDEKKLSDVIELACRRYVKFKEKEIHTMIEDNQEGEEG